MALPLSMGDLQTQTPTPTPTPAASPYWPQAGNMTTDSDYEIVGSQVFRFEYYYLLNNGSLSDIPWDTSTGHIGIDGMQDVAAIVVNIAVIDPKSKVLLTDAQLATFSTPGDANFLADFSPGNDSGPVAYSVAEHSQRNYGLAAARTFRYPLLPTISLSFPAHAEYTMKTFHRLPL